jgi:predicted dehydrogenase
MSYPAVVIGCGFMGSLFNEKPSYDPRHTHAASYKAHQQTNLAGLYDVNEERAAQAAAFWKVKNFTDLEIMFKETSPAIVSIASSTQSHEKMLQYAVEYPTVKGILCEKPIGLNVKESKKILKHAAKKNIVLAVNYSRRYNAGFTKVKDMLTNGTLGEIVSLRVLYQNGILNNGSHFIDLLRFFFGEIASVEARHCSKPNYKSDISAQIICKNGVEISLDAVEGDGAALAEIDIIGTKGRIRTEEGGHRIFYSPVGESSIFAGYKGFQDAENITDGYIDNTYNAIQDVIDCIEGRKEKPSCTGEDSVKSLEIVDLIIKSAKSCKKIKVK